MPDVKTVENRPRKQTDPQNTTPNELRQQSAENIFLRWCGSTSTRLRQIQSYMFCRCSMIATCACTCIYNISKVSMYMKIRILHIVFLYTYRLIGMCMWPPEMQPPTSQDRCIQKVRCTMREGQFLRTLPHIQE